MNNRHLFVRLRASMRRAAPAAIVVAVLFAGATVAQGQTVPPAGGQGQSQPSMTVDETQAKAMMAERQKMMESMRALDQKLNALVAKVNTTHGEAKIDAVATVVRELVAQRTQMHGQMEAMQTRMTNHMMQHMMSMQGGMMGMMNNRGQASSMPSMSACPMMQQLSKEAAEEDHSAHH
jgi:hypothetical protein